MSILNLTQHPATPEQVKAGVVDLQGEQLQFVKDLLTFEEIPDSQEIQRRAEKLAYFGMFYDPENIGNPIPVGWAMIGGAPFFMSALEKALRERGVTPMYAFSKRESIEQTMLDGMVRKTNIFKHVGFIKI